MKTIGLISRKGAEPQRKFCEDSFPEMAQAAQKQALAFTSFFPWRLCDFARNKLFPQHARPLTTYLAAALSLTLLLPIAVVQAKGDDFKSVVKLIERFYGVKHQGIPLLAKAGMKVATTAARIKGGTARRLAEAGSVKLAVFEDQAFDGEFTRFRASLNAALNETWTPLLQTLSATTAEQTYIFVREAGEKYNVLVITIEKREATVVQVTLSPKNFALLIKDPEGTGKSITEEATIIDQE